MIYLIRLCVELEELKSDLEVVTMATKKRSSKKKKNSSVHSFRTEIILWIIVAISLLLFISNFGIGGKVGNFFSQILFGLFGIVAYIFPILLLVGSFFAVSNKDNMFALIKLIASIFFILFICAFVSLIVAGDTYMTPSETYKIGYSAKKGGGFFGGILEYPMYYAFGKVGAFIVDIIGIIISLVIVTERSIMNGVKKGGKKVYESAKENNARYHEYLEKKSTEREERRMDKKVSGVSMDTKILKKENVDCVEIDGNTPKILEEKKVPISAGGPTIEGEYSKPPILGEPQTANADVPFGTVVHKELVDPPVSERNTVKVKLSNSELEQVTNEIKPIDNSDLPLQDYHFPPLHLLKSGNPNRKGNSETYLRETADKLQQTLKTFGVNVTVTNISCGPSVTRYEIQPEMGVKVSKIVNLADDIKLNLAASDIRMEAPIPGKAAIGIEIPNKENIMVTFRELLESKEYKHAKSKISFAVGKDIAGKSVIADIAKMPHLLIAGATGSGKSVCINTIIMSILYKARPDEVKLIMIDPKVVELSVYNGIPHLLIPVVTDPKKAAGALNWAVMEMTDRYQKFAQANVREISSYNQKVEEAKGLENTEHLVKMPHIVVIVDELADLMMVASNDVEESICRLAQLARAAGIHLVIATQRPSVNVITGLIKANMPSRIAFAVTSGIDSRTILDMNGAEKLLGKGDMLFHPQGMPKPVRIQGAFVSDREVSNIVSYITEKNGVAKYNEEVSKQVDSSEISNHTVSLAECESSDDGKDTYFMEAAEIVIDKEKASIGMLQRYLKIGFNRAARIMDQLEEAGIVGPEESTKPRKVLMTKMEFEQSFYTNS